MILADKCVAPAGLFAYFLHGKDIHPPGDNPLAGFSMGLVNEWLRPQTVALGEKRHIHRQKLSVRSANVGSVAPFSGIAAPMITVGSHYVLTAMWG